MQKANTSGVITSEQYDQYSADWLALLTNGNDDALQQAFQAPAGARVNFSTFSIDQILALVTTENAQLIKTRFLLVPDAADQPRFSPTLFAADADGKCLSEYYIPSQSAATTTQAVDPSAGPNTQIPSATALHWLTNWVNTSDLTIALFTTPHGPLHGYNFELSTFQDPLARAQPYDGKSLFLNYGLNTDTELTQVALVVYIGLTGSRTQGSLQGIPTAGTFYDTGTPCPPSL